MLVLQSWPRGLVGSGHDEAFAVFRARDDAGRKWSRIAIVIGDIQDARR